MIKLPNLQIVEVTTRDFTNLRKSLKDANVGENPVAIVLAPAATKNTAQEIITTLKEVCDKLFIDPKIPYPIFIVTAHHIQNSDFTFVKTKEDITSYYRLKMKKLKKRESNLLNKVKTFTTRINHYRVGESAKILQEHSRKHKLLKSTCKERSFYAEIIEKVEEAKKR